MPLHTCAPPRDAEPKPQTLWTCPACEAVWEAAPEEGGIFDFDRSDVVSRAAWIRVDGGSLLAG
jgi:hypothetical protein